MPRARTIRRVILATVAVVVVAAIGFSAYVLHQMREAFATHAARGRTALATHRQEFMNDQHLLASLPLFAPRPGKRDAGPVIGPRVRWALATSSASVHGVTLDRTAIDKLGKDWMHAGPGVWAGVDLAWMSRLAEYDLWDVDQNSIPPDLRFFFDTSPDSGDLQGWAKLRIAKGFHDGAVGPALIEVEDLARLCFTIERVDAQFDGLAILTLVRQARKRLAVTAPAPAADDERIPRIRRAIFGAIAFARLGTPASYEDDFSRIAVGRCAALHLGLQAALQLRAELRDARPEDYQHMERLLAAAPDCRLGSLRQRWALPDDERLFQRDSWWGRGRMMHWLPGYRYFQGEVALAISEQDWFKQYENRAASTGAMSDK